jgi:hypothetical protein
MCAAQWIMDKQSWGEKSQLFLFIIEKCPESCMYLWTTSKMVLFAAMGSEGSP